MLGRAKGMFVDCYNICTCPGTITHETIQLVRTSSFTFTGITAAFIDIDRTIATRVTGNAIASITGPKFFASGTIFAWLVQVTLFYVGVTVFSLPT